MSSAKPSSAADKLRDLLSRPEILTMPCVYDGLTARLVEDAGFPLTFMTGFGVSGAHGLPDTQVGFFRCQSCHSANGDIPESPGRTCYYLQQVRSGGY